MRPLPTSAAERHAPSGVANVIPAANPSVGALVPGLRRSLLRASDHHGASRSGIEHHFRVEGAFIWPPLQPAGPWTRVVVSSRPPRQPLGSPAEP